MIKKFTSLFPSDFESVFELRLLSKAWFFLVQVKDFMAPHYSRSRLDLRGLDQAKDDVKDSLA